MKNTKQGKRFRTPERKKRDKIFAAWFGKQMKKARKKSGLSPERFAEDILGVSISSYFQMTSGQSSLSDGRVAEMCQKMEVEYEVFIGGEKFIYET